MTRSQSKNTWMFPLCFKSVRGAKDIRCFDFHLRVARAILFNLYGWSGVSLFQFSCGASYHCELLNSVLSSRIHHREELQSTPPRKARIHRREELQSRPPKRAAKHIVVLDTPPRRAVYLIFPCARYTIEKSCISYLPFSQ